MKTLFISAAALAAACAFSATSALAGSMTVEGTGMGQSMTEPMPVTDGMVVLKLDTMYEGFDSDDPDNPFRTAKGPCMGAALVMGGQIEGQGFCRYTDGDGDIAVIKWVATGLTAEGRTTGTWEVKGGTGKWADASGGGSFDAGTSTGSYTNMVSGEVTMP